MKPGGSVLAITRASGIQARTIVSLCAYVEVSLGVVGPGGVGLIRGGGGPRKQGSGGGGGEVYAVGGDGGEGRFGEGNWGAWGCGRGSLDSPPPRHPPAPPPTPVQPPVMARARVATVERE